MVYPIRHVSLAERSGARSFRLLESERSDTELATRLLPNRIGYTLGSSDKLNAQRNEADPAVGGS